MKRKHISSLAMALIAITFMEARGVTLVESGAPGALLIVEADSPKAQRAAEALQAYIAKMSGVTLPLVLEGDPLPTEAPAGRVHVGHTAAAEGQNVPSGFDPTVRDNTLGSLLPADEFFEDHPAFFAGQEVKLYLGGLINQGWVWINGDYVGHRPWAVWWNHSRHPAEFSVGDKLHPGQRNTIAIRVLNSPDEVGGLYSFAFGGKYGGPA